MSSNGSCPDGPAEVHLDFLDTNWAFDWTTTPMFARRSDVHLHFTSTCHTIACWVRIYSRVNMKVSNNAHVNKWWDFARYMLWKITWEHMRIKNTRLCMHRPPDAGAHPTLTKSSKLSGMLCHYQPFHPTFLLNLKANAAHNLHTTTWGEQFGLLSDQATRRLQEELRICFKSSLDQRF